MEAGVNSKTVWLLQISLYKIPFFSLTSSVDKNRINNETIERKTHTKFLGVYVMKT